VTPAQPYYNSNQASNHVKKLGLSL